jgi:hypothetical protein
MIVLDASSTMNESFHGQSKWEVALNSLNVIINGLNPYAKYGLVVIGGSDSSGLGDPCGDPSTPAIAFSTREAVWSHIIQLQPKGGGSFSTAFTLAKTQLQGLSRDKIGTLIFITGSEDACRGGDVWIDLGKIVPDLDTIRLRSEIIILDEDGLKTQTLADQINSLSENINVQAPQSVQELREITNVIVINNVTKYINIEMAARATEGPRPATSIATNTIAPIVTIIGPPPTLTAIPPTQIPPTPIPPTPIPSPTESPKPFTILYPPNGTAYNCDPNVLCIQTVTVQWVPEEQVGNLHLSIWVKPFPGNPNYQYYVQPSPYYIGNSQWTSTEIYIGQPGDPIGTPFRIYALITTEVYTRGQSFDNLPTNPALSSFVDVTR